MQWWGVAIITYLVMCSVTVVVYLVSDEEKALAWALGIPCLIINIVTVPVRTWRRYSRCKSYYKKRGISRLAFMLGKR